MKRTYAHHNEYKELHTYNVMLSATYTVNATSYDEAIKKARERAEVYELDAGYIDIEELPYDPEFD